MKAAWNASRDKELRVHTDGHSFLFPEAFRDDWDFFMGVEVWKDLPPAYDGQVYYQISQCQRLRKVNVPIANYASGYLLPFVSKREQTEKQPDLKQAPMKSQSNWRHVKDIYINVALEVLRAFRVGISTQDRALLECYWSGNKNRVTGHLIPNKSYSWLINLLNITPQFNLKYTTVNQYTPCNLLLWLRDIEVIRNLPDNQLKPGHIDSDPYLHHQRGLAGELWGVGKQVLFT